MNSSSAAANDGGDDAAFAADDGKEKNEEEEEDAGGAAGAAGEGGGGGDKDDDGGAGGRGEESPYPYESDDGDGDSDDYCFYGYEILEVAEDDEEYEQVLVEEEREGPRRRRRGATAAATATSPPPSPRQKLTKMRHRAARQAEMTGRAVKRRWRRVVTGSSDRRVRDWARDPRVVKAVDKFSFATGVATLGVTEYVFLSRTREEFGFYYCAVVAYLMVLRLYMYAKNRYLYFLIDFCYVANASCFVSVLLYPESARLWRLNYAVSNGPLLGAALAWRNSLVFHSLDKVTSLAIHVLPALLTYLERWSTDGGGEGSGSGSSRMCPAAGDDGDGGGNCSVDVMGWFVEPLIFYAAWQLLYVAKTEFVDREVMKSNPSLQTSMRWLVRDRTNGMHRVARRACRLAGVLKPDEEFDPEAFKTKLVFWIGQFLFTALTLLPVPFLFGRRWLNAAHVLAVLCVAVYNGSNYYFEVFAKRYVKQLHSAEAAGMEAKPPGASRAEKTE